MNKILSYPAIGVLRLYQLTLSPAFTSAGLRCRHEPTCSQYSIYAIRQHGVWAGGWMTLARLSRCHPFGSSGLDNVPESITKPPFWAPWRYGVWRVENEEYCNGHDHIS
ncbi:MAG: membrane protein insertion efficiency factor YidD [Hyphomonadaceae bacterium]|nr:membrane protein insertion efficiency factor YidD [Hyphomonadaceae bacterium]